MMDRYTLTMPDSYVFCSLSAELFFSLFRQLHMPELYRDRNPHGHKKHLSTGFGDFLCGDEQISCVALANSIESLILARAAARQWCFICPTGQITV